MTVGYGFSAGGDYSQSKINASHQSISGQSGIYAGNDGYQINVAQHTDLKGGIITSTQSAEDTGKNRFSTGTLTFSDIQNHSQYKGESFGIGASASISGKTLGQGEQNHPQESHLKTVADKNGTSSSIGYGSHQDSRSSLTRSGIGTRNIVIADDPTGAQAQTIYTDIRSETAEQNSGRLNNAFDRDAVRQELDLQREVSQTFSRNVQEAKAEVNKQIDGLKAKKEAGEISEAEYRNKLQNLQYFNVGISSLSGALMAPTDSALGMAAAAASPAVSYHIGQHFKENDELNKLDGGSRPSEGSKEHIALHTLNGMLTGAAGGNNALLSGLAAGGAELLAPALAGTLFNKSSADLTAEEKATVSSLTAVFGATVGAASGNASDAVAGRLAAHGAVENNVHLRIGERAIKNAEFKACKGNRICEQTVDAKWEQKAINHQKELYAACDKGVATPECNTFRNKIDRSTYSGWKDYWYPTGIELSASMDAALYAIFGGNIKVDVAIGNRGAAAQFGGGIGIGIGGKAKVGKWEREDRGVSVSSSTILGEKTFGSKPNPSSATLSTKASAELNVGVVNLNTEIVGGKEYKEDGTSSIYRNWSNNAAFKTQIGIGGVAKWDFLNYRTSKHEKILR